MKMRACLIAIITILLMAPAVAQQSDAATLQRLLSAVENQRNQALTQHAMAEARAAGLTEELTKANARIKELEPKAEPEKSK